jgi:transcriptional regulator with XRE-family HTH domain
MAGMTLHLGTPGVNSLDFRTQRVRCVTLRDRGTVKNLRQRAVRAFLSSAIQKVGGTQDKLAIWLTFEGYGVQRTTVSRWITGTNDPPAFVLFHIAAELHLSLDEFALGDPRHQSLAQRVGGLELQLTALLARLDQLVAVVQRLATPSEQAILRQMTSQE